MRITPNMLSKKIASFINQLENDDCLVLLYPQNFDIEQAKIIGQALGWTDIPKNKIYPCYSINEVHVRRLS